MNEALIADRVARSCASARRQAMAVNIYRQGCEVDIASDVVATGKSAGWIVPNQENPSYRRALSVAKAVERRLASFNIGYTDDMLGEWTQVTGGTRFFEGMA